MIRKLKTYIIVAVASLGLFAPALIPASASAASGGIVSGLCQGVNNATGEGNGTGCGNAGKGGTTDLSNVASKVVNIFSVVVGIVAVIMIIYGGFKYITSGGGDGVTGAKNTLIYAIVGLVVVALAQIIVHYVINTTQSGVGNLQ
ncbi:MAG TPA: pilin [Candidatus Saccharimonadales bacterium]|nr:pilin [Candidatus Saccharimonadales bacterium]